MNIVQEFIILFTLVLLAAGWWVHNWTVLARLTRLKGRKITLAWFARNRPYKLKISATSSLISGFITFVYFDPQSMDLAVQAGRQSLAFYMSTIFSIGLGADLIVDQIGSRAKAGRREQYHDEHEPEDGKSLVDKERADKIIAEHEKHNGNL